MKMKIQLVLLGLVAIAVLAHLGLTFVAVWETFTKPEILKLLKDRIDFLMVWLFVGVMLMLLLVDRLNAVKKLRSE
jgi:hypothetical protein